MNDKDLLLAYQNTGLMPKEITHLRAELARVEREKDAAVADLKRMPNCTTCLHRKDKPGRGSCDNCDINYSGWQWRGAEEI